MWPTSWPVNVRGIFEKTTAMTVDGHQALAFSLGLRSRPHWVRFAGFVYLLYISKLAWLALELSLSGGFFWFWNIFFIFLLGGTIFAPMCDSGCNFSGFSQRIADHVIDDCRFQFYFLVTVRLVVQQVFQIVLHFFQLVNL